GRRAAGGSRSGAVARRAAGGRRGARLSAAPQPRTAPASASSLACAGTPGGSRSLFSAPWSGAPLLRPLDRLAKRGHQVDDLALLLGLRLGQLPALRLRTDELEQLLAVGVGVLLGLERLAEVSASAFAISTSTFCTLAAPRSPSSCAGRRISS